MIFDTEHSILTCPYMQKLINKLYLLVYSLNEL